jgi:proline dehydrogenase
MTAPTDPVRALLDEMRPGARRLLSRVLDYQVIADITAASETYPAPELARLITHHTSGLANQAALMKHRLRRYAERDQSDEQTGRPNA